MQDLLQEVLFAQSWVPQTLASAHTVEWMNVENHKYVTFVITSGGTSVSGSTMYKIQMGTNKSGGGAATIPYPFVGNCFYTNDAAATTTVFVQGTPTMTSSTSVSCAMVPVDSTNNTITAFTVDTTAATNDSKPYIACVANSSSASSTSQACLAILHGSRYANETKYDVLA